MTKHLDARKVGEYLTRMNVVFMSGRSEKASNLYVCDEHVQGRNNDNEQGDARRTVETSEKGDETCDQGVGRNIRGGDTSCEDESTGGRRRDSEETSEVVDAMHAHGGGA